MYGTPSSSTRPAEDVYYNTVSYEDGKVVDWQYD